MLTTSQSIHRAFASNFVFVLALMILTLLLYPQYESATRKISNPNPINDQRTHDESLSRRAGDGERVRARRVLFSCPCQ